MILVAVTHESKLKHLTHLLGASLHLRCYVLQNDTITMHTITMHDYHAGIRETQLVCDGPMPS